MFWSKGKTKPVQHEDHAEVKNLRAQIAALSKAFAVIEFDLEGNILTANENFCKTLGYTLEEIQGKHHRIFVDPDYASKPEYSAFWEKLRRGEFSAGQYQRFGKGGKTIWIEASYNPVLDANGAPVKIVKYATDITAQKNLALETQRIKSALDSCTTNVMIADAQCNIIYMNQSVTKMMGDNQAELRKTLPQFNAEKLIGANIDVFHKNPSHQRNMLAHLRETHRAQIKVGDLSFSLIATPVFDDKGVRLGTAVEWKDRTAEVRVESQISNLVQAAVAGDLTARFDASGDNSIFQVVGGGINQILDTLTSVVCRIKEASEAIDTASNEIMQGNTDLSQRTEEQASSLEETASSMEELTSTVKQNAENARQANQLAVGAADVAVKGGDVVREVVTTMSGISESSKKIADIIGTIDGIAFQTNILALNAAVEAARAGEQGRGFAVVATEVRNLAQRSANAAKEIKELITDSVRRVDTGTQLVDEAGKTMGEIVTSVKRVTDIIAEISAASQEQSSGIEQVNQAITQMDEVTQQNAALVEEAAAAAESMQEQTNSLVQTVNGFRLAQDSGVHASANADTRRKVSGATRASVARPKRKAA
jgi:methyl-accepting chemotaxis protein